MIARILKRLSVHLTKVALSKVLGSIQKATVPLDRNICVDFKSVLQTTINNCRNIRLPPHHLNLTNGATKNH